MSRDDARDLAVGVALTALAGWVDAVGFLSLDQLFVSFMSGNSTKLVTYVARGNGPEAIRAGAVVAAFVSGVCAGRLLVRAIAGQGRALVLGCVALLLGAVLALGDRSALAAGVTMAFAMGLQNNAMRKIGDVKAGATYVTGTLVNLGERLGDALCGDASDWPAHALLWVGLACGGLAGALAYLRVGLAALAAPALGAALLAVLASGLLGRTPPEPP